MRAVALVFGNTMPGPVEINPPNGTSESTASFYKNISCKSPPIIEETLHKFCPFESSRVMEKKTAKTNFVRDINFNNGCYEVKLPWENDHPLLQYNFMLAQCWFDHKLAKILK